MLKKITIATLIITGISLGACTTVEAMPEPADTSNLSLEAGYAYPAPNVSEVVPTIVSDNVEVPPFEARVQFVAQLTQVLESRPYPPQALIMTEGDDHETIVFLDTGRLNVNTPYKARAIAAQMSSITRNNPLFAQYGVENYTSVFDLFKILGFRQVVITNGDDFSHRFVITPGSSNFDFR